MILIDTEFPEHLHHTTNEIYAGVHFRRRAEIKRKFLWWIKSRQLPKEAHFLKAVHVHFAFTFRSRPYDSDNCSFMGKMITDGMKAVGVFKDDSIKHIKSVTYTSQKGKRDYLLVEAFDFINFCDEAVVGMTTGMT